MNLQKLCAPTKNTLIFSSPSPQDSLSPTRVIPLASMLAVTLRRAAHQWHLNQAKGQIRRLNPLTKQAQALSRFCLGLITIPLHDILHCEAASTVSMFASAFDRIRISLRQTWPLRCMQMMVEPSQAALIGYMPWRSIEMPMAAPKLHSRYPISRF